MGIPLFFLELAIGQSIRKGSIGVWNHIHPYLGGVGIASVVLSLLISIYYNVLLGWCFYYMFASFQSPLPYSSCPQTNGESLIPASHEKVRMFVVMMKVEMTS